MSADAATTVAAYSMQTWMFEDALGRYDIDLASSNIACRELGELTVRPGLELEYGTDRGGRRLRSLIAGLYRADSSGPAADETAGTDRVVVTHGAQEALYLLYCTLLRPGEQVITFTPGWAQSWLAPARLGARVTTLPLGPELAIDLDAVEAAATADLRLIVVNSPNSPSGRKISVDDRQRLLALAERHGGYLLMDEDYVVDLADSPTADRVISVSSLSKIYGLPGLRIGWLHGPAEVVAECVRYKHLTSIANSVLCEELACEVLTHRDQYVTHYRRLVSTGLEVLDDWLAGHPERFRLVRPEGTPFGWVELLGEPDSLAFCRRVLSTGVLLMPGETLGTSGGFRITFARDPAVLTEALRRIDGILTDRRPAIGKARSNDGL